MSKFAEIRDRFAEHKNSKCLMPRHDHAIAELLDLVTRARAVLVEVVGSGVEFDHPKLSYLVMHIERGTMAEAIALIEETKP